MKSISRLALLALAVFGIAGLNYSALRAADAPTKPVVATKPAVAAKDAVHFLGMPEGNTALAQAALYLATAPKSNAVYAAYGQAAEAAQQDVAEPVPLHLRNAPTKLMKVLDYGKGYRYAHDEEDAFAAGENYFPDGMKAPRFYRPVDRGLEIRIAEKLRSLRQLNEDKQ